MTRPCDTRTALDAYLEHHTDVVAILERLLTHYRNHDDADPERLDWGHVGSIAHVHAQLREISDFEFGEGEHAHVTCAGFTGGNAWGPCAECGRRLEDHTA